MQCKYCGSDIMVKDGMVGGKQRWKCTKCKRTSREGDKREKHSIIKKISVLRQLADGKLSLNKIALIGGIKRSLILYWKKHYKNIMTKEINAIQYPKDIKGITLIDRSHLKQVIDDNCNCAFGVIWTENGGKVFIMKN